MIARNILKLAHPEAKKFFLKGESYCNFDLPPYFKFDQILFDIDKALAGKNLSDFLETIKILKNGALKEKADSPRHHEDTNYKILNNKDGKYAWRPMQLIHPVLYVSLVHKITEEENWKFIQDRFDKFSQSRNIECMSVPVISSPGETDRATQISHWWQEVEQKSVILALDYEHLVHTDISDCYGSIYTHSVAWALHTKQEAKTNKNNKNLVGNVIDSHLQDMSHGQTNGIPQGSVLMDFIAEIVLGYADLLLSKKMNGEISDYHIIRYRDDYRIFTNSTQDGEKIITFLTEVMIELGLKLNPQKTSATNQVISGSIKSDKLYWNKHKQREKNIQKHLLLIHDLSNEFPNSGSLNKALKIFFDRIINIKRLNENVVLLISIIVDIAYRNPRTYPISTAILSLFVTLLKDDVQKRDIFSKIEKRFRKIPNTGHLMVWLQRITLKLEGDYPYNEPICQLVADNQVEIWNSKWLKPPLKYLIDPEKIIDRNEIDKLTPIIQKQEVELFKLPGGSS